MSIFNSLGSNYDFGFALNSLFANRKSKDSEKLRNYLQEKYQGKVIFTYKGREALRVALRIINKSDEYRVGVCGFTCFAVEEAVVKERYKIEYLDIEKDTLNFSLETLKKAVSKNQKLKIIFIQNTLGNPCDIEAISKFCKEKGIILVEDLAHSIGAKYKNGKEAGTVGDFVMLSFSQDKVIDDVSGGALVVRNDKYQISNIKFQISNKSQVVKDKLYPLFTFVIRSTYKIGLGKFFHLFLKKTNLLSKPMEYIGQDNIHDLTEDKFKQIYDQFVNHKDNLNHRRKIAKIYSDTIDSKILSKKILTNIDLSTNIRFPIFVDSRKKLINFFKKYGVFISDIWYDAPIAPKKYLNKSKYKMGQCPNSEFVSEKILNLPTHKNVTESDADFIANKINIWLNSQ